MKSNKPIASVILFLTTACLIITALMTRQSGVSNAASGDGQQLLGWASIAIHLGLPAFGIAAGAFLRAGNKVMGWCALFLVLLCASFSITNIMSFVAAERISISKAREAEAKSKTAREEAALKAVEKRQDTINKMAQDQIAFLRTETKHADGRREKNDARDSGSKFIQDFSKTEIVVAPTAETGPVTVRPDAGAEMIAEITGWNISAIQLGNIVQIAILLIIFESVGWPMGSYLWATGRAPVTEGVLEPVHPPRNLAPTAREQRLLPPPRRDKPPTIRVEPDAGWRALLDDVDYPAAGSIVQGTPRHKDKREHVAPRFLVWLHAHGLAGDITTDNMAALYERFNSIDHRVPWGERIVKSELEALGKRFASKSQANSTTVYSIPIQTPDKVRSLLEKRGVLTANRAVSTPETEPEDEPDTAESAEGAESKLLSFSMFRTKHAGGQVH